MNLSNYWLIVRLLKTKNWGMGEETLRFIIHDCLQTNTFAYTKGHFAKT